MGKEIRTPWCYYQDTFYCGIGKIIEVDERSGDVKIILSENSLSSETWNIKFIEEASSRLETVIDYFVRHGPKITTRKNVTKEMKLNFPSYFAQKHSSE